MCVVNSAQRTSQLIHSNPRFSLFSRGFQQTSWFTDTFYSLVHEKCISYFTLVMKLLTELRSSRIKTFVFTLCRGLIYGKVWKSRLDVSLACYRVAACYGDLLYGLGLSYSVRFSVGRLWNMNL